MKKETMKNFVKGLLGLMFFYGFFHDTFGQTIANIALLVLFLVLYIISKKTIREREENFKNTGIYESNSERDDRRGHEILFGKPNPLTDITEIFEDDLEAKNEFLKNNPKYRDTGYKQAEAEESLSEANEIINKWKSKEKDEN